MLMWITAVLLLTSRASRSLLPEGVSRAITYSCRRLLILAKASAWMERMALSPRFLQAQPQAV